jgi:hypothetical protein
MNINKHTYIFTTDIHTMHSDGQMAKWSDDQMAIWPDGHMVQWSDSPMVQ